MRLRCILTGAVLALCVTTVAAVEEVCSADRDAGILEQTLNLIAGGLGGGGSSSSANKRQAVVGSRARKRSDTVQRGHPLQADDGHNVTTYSVYLGQLSLTNRMGKQNQQEINHQFRDGDTVSLADAILKRASSLNTENVVQAAEKLAEKLPNSTAANDHNAGTAFHLLAQRLIYKPRNFSPAQFTQALRAIAVDADFHDPDLSRAAASHFGARHAKYAFSDCAALAESLAAMNAHVPQVMDAIADRLLRIFDGPHELPSNDRLAVTATAFSTLRHKRADLFEALSKETQPHGSFSSELMTSMLWAYAHLLEPAPSLFDTAARHMSASWEDMLSSDVVMTLWAFTTLQVNDTRVFSSAADHLLRHGICYSPHELTRLVWAFATQRIAVPELYAAVADLAVAQYHAFSSGDLADLLWGMAIMDVQAPELFEAAETHAMQKMEDYDPHSLSNLVWSFAASGVRSEALFRRVASRVEHTLAGIPGQSMHIIVHSFQLAGLPHLLRAPGVQLVC